MRRGRPPVADVLTPREWEVLGLLREGLTNAEIGERLGISANTAKYHVGEILGKLRVGSREAAAAWSPEEGRGARLRGLGPLAWAGRWAPGWGAKVAMGLAAAGVVVAFVVAIGALAGGGEGLGKLVWVQEGDLWVRTLPDGQPERLTSDGRNAFPRWSPSGEWVLFSHQRGEGEPETWVVRADGRDRRRVETAHFYAVQWRPGDDLLLSQQDGRVVLENVGTGATRTLIERSVSATEQSEILPWSTPDGEHVVFIEERRVGDGSRAPRSDDDWTYFGLSVMDSDGSNRRELVNLGGSPTTQIAPLGFAGSEYVLFAEVASDAGESVFDGVGLRRVSIRDGAVEDLRTTVGILGGASEESKGRVLLVTGEQRESWTNKRVAVVSAESPPVRRITTPDVVALSPQWSADGDRIVYVSAPDFGAGERERALASRRLWVMDADGSNARQVSRDEEYRHEAPQWSRDGKHVLFARLTLDRCSPSFTLQLLDTRDRSMREVASGLPRIWSYNERLVVDEVPECPHDVEGVRVSDTYGNLGARQGYDWWQPRRGR